MIDHPRECFICKLFAMKNDVIETIPLSWNNDSKYPAICLWGKLNKAQ